MKTLTIRGTVYEVRYTTLSGTAAGAIKAVLNTDKLQGEFGDEWPLIKVNGKYVPAP